MPAHIKNFRFSLRGLLIATAGVAVVVAAANLGLRRLHQDAITSGIRRNLRSIYFALSTHEDARGHWPAPTRTDSKGRILYSWRFAIWPYMESAKMGEYKQPWNAPSNASSRAVVHWCFDWDYRDRSTMTDAFAIVGRDTSFDPERLRSHREFPEHLVTVMEVADSKTHWMQPGDYEVDQLLAATGRLGDTVQGLLNDRIHILFADGEVWALSPDMPIDAVKPFLTINAAKAADREKQLAPYRVDD